MARPPRLAGPGQINGFFRWSDGKASVSSVSVNLFLADLKSKHFTVPESAVADVSLRRIGPFKVKCGDSVSWKFGGRSGTAVVGADGLVTVHGLAVSKAPQTLVVSR